MTVYVLSQVWQTYSGECGNDVEVFETFEEAQKRLDVLINEAKNDFKDLTTEEDNFVGGDISWWSIWEKENYVYNHIDLTIKEREVM